MSLSCSNFRGISRRLQIKGRSKKQMSRDRHNGKSAAFCHVLAWVVDPSIFPLSSSSEVMIQTDLNTHLQQPQQLRGLQSQLSRRQAAPRPRAPPPTGVGDGGGVLTDATAGSDFVNSGVCNYLLSSCTDQPDIGSLSRAILILSGW